MSQLILSWTCNKVNLDIKPSLKIKTEEEAWQARWEVTLDLGTCLFDFGIHGQFRIIKTNVYKNHNESYQVEGLRKGFYFNDKLKINDRLFATIGARFFPLNLLDNRWSR
ncbi:MAG: hypothetical protein N3B16_04110 [Candidatus Aminicenantes bacterium]|nr:hypothetical protein [Candidatus Aminicenantes bacterium]